MARTLVPITVPVLEWAVREDGRALDDISDAAQLEAPDLQAWLAGEAQPSVGQLTRLANALGRPRAMFLMPRAPEQASLPASFRHPPGDSREVAPQTRRHVRRARRIQQAVSWARRDEPTVDMPQVLQRTSPEVAALTAHEWLPVTARQWAAWRDDRLALNAWRSMLEERDVLVFSLQLGQDSVRGFSAWDAAAPMIVLNVSGVSPAARSFTLAHELGHLLIRQDATCVDDAGGLSAHGVERWCEEFAVRSSCHATMCRRSPRCGPLNGSTSTR